MNWLFLRGLAREQRHWGLFRSVFEESNKGQKTFCLDLPGVGTEYRRHSPVTIESILYDLRGRWISLAQNNPGPWAILSMSMGGMVGMEWASLFPRDLEKLVLINSSAGNLNLPTDRLRWSVLPDFFKTALAEKPLKREMGILKMTTALQKDLSGIAKEWISIDESAPVSVKTGLAQLAAAALYRAPSKLNLPVLVLSSMGDQFVNPHCSTLLAERFQAKHEIHPLAGHDLTLDDPKWVAEKIHDWIAPQL